MFEVNNEVVGAGNVFVGQPGTGAFTKALESTINMINEGRGAYVTDLYGKSWKNIKTNRDEDIRVIGGGEDQYGIDLLAGLNPNEAASLIIKSVSNFAPHVDSYIIRYRNKAIHAATALAYGLSFTPDLNKYESRYNMGVYTIGFVKELLMDESLRNEVINEVIPDEGCYIKKDDAFFVMDFFNNKLIYADKELWDAILAEAVLLLEMVSAVPESIKDRFINGNCEKKVDLGSALEGKIICNAIDTTVCTGAHSLSIMLKTKLMMLADKRACELEKAGKDIRDELPGCVLFSENYQELATFSRIVESDYSFPNRARSLGVTYNVIVPSEESLVSKVGQVNSDYILSVLNKVSTK